MAGMMEKTCCGATLHSGDYGANLLWCCCCRTHLSPTHLRRRKRGVPSHRNRLLLVERVPRCVRDNRPHYTSHGTQDDEEEDASAAHPGEHLAPGFREAGSLIVGMIDQADPGTWGLLISPKEPVPLPLKPKDTSEKIRIVAL